MMKIGVLQPFQHYLMLVAKGENIDLTFCCLKILFPNKINPLQSGDPYKRVISKQGRPRSDFVEWGSRNGVSDQGLYCLQIV